LKALEALAEKHPDNEEVMTALNAQIAKENDEKAKKKEVKINVDALPEHLKSLVG
jgi:mRNA-degrading endonuclease HigB of HigAB toxin-antitoxin module